MDNIIFESDKDDNEIIFGEIVDFSKMRNEIKDLLEKNINIHYQNYLDKNHKTTSMIMGNLLIELEGLNMLLQYIIKLKDLQGTWIVIYRILNKLLYTIRSSFKKLPLISENEPITKFMRRKFAIPIFQVKIKSVVDDLEILTYVLPYLIAISNNSQRRFSEKLIAAIEQKYIYPFWYDLDNELKGFRDTINIFQTTMISKDKQNNISKLFSTISSAVNSEYSEVITSKLVTKNNHYQLKHKGLVEFLKKLWNIGEKEIGEKAFSLLNTNVKIAQWIKIKSVETLILFNNDLPFEINNMNQSSNIILHFHGGGFISGTPHSHEIYLRRWAKETNSIVISVNYSKAPEAKYPIALNECYRVYKYIIKNNQQGIIPKKIILAGDSAGGNLALGVCIKAIENKLRIPDGLLLFYPVLDNFKHITASRFLFSYDILLSYNILLTTIDSYLPNNSDPKNDPLISPVNASDDILKKLPDNIFIINSGFDPLLDDSTIFIKKLRNINKNVRNWIYNLPHGFLNFGFLIPSVELVIQKSCQLINSVFD